jgi:hypothetical protein
VARRDWDKVRRTTPVRARGGQGIYERERPVPLLPRPKTSLAVLSVLMPALSNAGLRRMRASLVKANGPQAVEDLFDAEHGRRDAGLPVSPYVGESANAKDLDLDEALNELGQDDLRALGSAELTDDLPFGLWSSAVNLSRAIRAVEAVLYAR